MSSLSEDRYDIGQVMIRYATSVDQRDMERYGSCFRDDAEILGFGAEPIVGRQAWVDYVSGALANFGGTHHQITNQEITIDDDTAHMRSYVQATHELLGDDEHLLILYAIYDDRLVRSDAGWQITHHALDRLIDAKKVSIAS